MKKFHKASLLKYNANCNEHANSYQDIKDYNFNINIEMIKQLLESTDFTGGIFFNENDLKHFIVENKFMVGLEIEDDDLDDWRYLFDAFNVYLNTNGSEYYNNCSKLTKAWRNIMKQEYANTTYAKDLRMHIEEERTKALAEINNEYDEQIKNI